MLKEMSELMKQNQTLLMNTASRVEKLEQAKPEKVVEPVQEIPAVVARMVDTSAVPKIDNSTREGFIQNIENLIRQHQNGGM
ncbi:hypothetical protein pCXcHC2016_16 [Xenohaliotis phage pCXc-HC2016]|nr:hypothetical protein pCXcHC2016_16 [Xenohaliotis phage pCXc-HC2016]